MRIRTGADHEERRQAGWALVRARSLLAVSLVVEAEARLGIELSLARVLESPTIDRILRRGPSRAPQPKYILSFNRNGRRPALVFFPDSHGTVMGSRRFPKLFGPDQPLYIAQAVGADPTDCIRHPTIEKIAEVYERELLDVLAPGPVVLGGFSFGALVAFELTRRLRRRGFDVPLVVSLDGYAPGYPEPLPPGQRVWAHLRCFAESSGDERRGYLRDRYDHLCHRVWGWLGQEHRLSEYSPWMTPEMRRRFARMWRMNSLAARRYRPPPVDGATMLLVRAERSARWVGIARSDEVHGWASFVRSGISVVTVSGEHASILRDANQPLIVEAIRRHLPTGWNDASERPQNEDYDLRNAGLSAPSSALSGLPEAAHAARISHSSPR